MSCSYIWKKSFRYIAYMHIYYTRAVQGRFHSLTQLTSTRKTPTKSAAESIWDWSIRHEENKIRYFFYSSAGGPPPYVRKLSTRHIRLILCLRQNHLSLNDIFFIFKETYSFILFKCTCKVNGVFLLFAVETEDKMIGTITSRVVENLFSLRRSFWLLVQWSPSDTWM